MDYKIAMVFTDAVNSEFPVYRDAYYNLILAKNRNNAIPLIITGKRNAQAKEQQVNRLCASLSEIYHIGKQGEFSQPYAEMKEHHGYKDEYYIQIIMPQRQGGN